MVGQQPKKKRPLTSKQEEPKCSARLTTPSRIKRVAVSAFLFFHITAITSWCVPFDSPLRAALTSAVRPYVLWSGLFQSWDMFAPTPKSVNAHVEAIVIHKDGHVQNWTFPRMEQLSVSERYLKERYRKYVENLRQDANVALWPDAARHIARLNDDVSNPPEIVILVRYWSDIVPRADLSYEPQRTHRQIFYEYKVGPEDLK